MGEILRVHYSRKLSSMMLFGAGLLLVVMGLELALAQRSRYLELFVGGAGLAVGILMRVRPILELHADRIVLLALVGPFRRTFRFASRAELRIEGDRVYVGEKRLPLRASGCDPRDWAKLAAAIQFG